MGILKEWKTWLRLRKNEMDIQSVAIGMNSTVDHTRDRHIIMLDYDEVTLEEVKYSVDELQTFWKLGQADIFKTRNGFHVFFWYDIVPYERLKMIIHYARDVDPMFKFISQYYDRKTIRVAGKYQEKDIEYVETISTGRRPSEIDAMIGDLKKNEHASLLSRQI